MEQTVEYIKRKAQITKIAKIAGKLCVLGLGLFGVIEVAGWVGHHRENRQWIAVNNITPERLLARCGPPVEDRTKEVFPIIERDMSYKGGDKGTVVLAFSRTAEEKSDWVFLTMKDAQGDTSYDTPEAIISAMSCLDSRK